MSASSTNTPGAPAQQSLTAFPVSEHAAGAEHATALTSYKVDVPSPPLVGVVSQRATLPSVVPVVGVTLASGAPVVGAPLANGAPAATAAMPNSAALVNPPGASTSAGAEDAQTASSRTQPTPTPGGPVSPPPAAASSEAAPQLSAEQPGRRGDPRAMASSAARAATLGGALATTGAPSQAFASSAAQALDGAAPPATPASPLAAQAASASGIDMQAMVDSIRATIELAARQGGAQARIALQPEGLGGIRVHLSQTADGLLARLVPETPAAAQALAEGHSELHRSLSSLGTPLLRMDVGSYAQPDARPRDERFAGRPDGSGTGVSAPSEDPQGLDAVGLDHDIQRESEPADGGLVNVLA
jgi:hypothetical protein